MSVLTSSERRSSQEPKNFRHKEPIREDGRMLFPWGDYERIFPPGSQISKDAYKDVYDMITNEAIYWSLILGDTVLCVDSIVMLVGLKLVTIELENLDRVKRTIKNCIARKDERLIPILINHVTLFKKKHDRASFPLDLEGSDDPILDIDISGAHSNVLIIDKKHKIVEYFEPHGNSGGLVEYLRTKSIAIQTALKGVIPSDYKFIYGDELCPTPGPQKDEPLCFAWGLLYFHLRMKNPHMTGKQIIQEIIKETKIGPPLVYDWLDVMHTTLEELHDEYSSYSDRTKDNIAMTEMYLKPISSWKIAMIIAEKEYLPLSPRQDEPFMKFRDGECVISDDKSIIYVKVSKTEEQFKKEPGIPVGDLRTMFVMNKIK